MSYVWQHPQLDSFPERQRAWIIHAQNFSEAIYGAVVLYDLMLAEGELTLVSVRVWV